VIHSCTRSEKIGVMLPACAGFYVVAFGGLWGRRVLVPLNFLLSAAELRKIIEDSGIDLVIHVHHFNDLVKQLPVRSLALEDVGLKWRTVLAMLRRRPPAPTVQVDDIAVLLYTSGTDGEPKGVELTYANLRSNCDDCIATAGITSEHRLLNILPPFHVFGLTANVLIPMVLGGSVHCIPRFEPAAVVRAMAQENPSVFMAIPSMFAALLRMKSTPPDTYSRLYLAVSGGEPLHESVAHGFHDRFGVELLQGYGLTETSPVVSLNTPNANRPGSVGRPVRNVHVRIIDPRQGDVPRGGDGEVWIKSPGVMRGYHNRPELTRSVIDAEGWFRTGDIGRLDEGGYLFITGRKKEMMIVGGENVFPAGIEKVLLTHPAVAEAAVVGAPDASRGEVPIAFVTLREGVGTSESDLRAFAREQLAGHKVPRRVIIRDDLPHGPTGKIHKRLLRRELGSNGEEPVRD
jgi:long-chain acyl-CoA synthetase